MNLFLCIASGNDVPPGKLDRFRPYMVEALRKVHLRDYFGCLVTAKWLVVQLVSEIIRESRGEPPLAGPSSLFGAGPDGTAEGDNAESDSPDPEESDQAPQSGHGREAWSPPEVNASHSDRCKAMQDTIDRLGEAPSELTTEVGESKFKRSGEQKLAERKSEAAIKANVKDSGNLEKTLDASSKYMMNLVDKARHNVRNAPHHDDHIREEAYAKITFTDVEPSEHRDPYVGLNEEDEETVRRLRAVFHKVMGRRVNTLEETGAQPSIPAYIERRMTGEPIPIFHADKNGRGFKTLILVDRSASMQGRRTEQAERSCQIISRALKFPFVKRKVWGFQSWDDGVVNISRFRPGQEIFESGAAQVGGMTPLHTAIRVAVRELEDGTDKKHLFIISDGFPTYIKSDGEIFGTNTLMSFVRSNIMHARSKGIGVTGVMIGQDIKPAGMSRMFGSSKYWRVMSDQTFGDDLIQLVIKAFTDYLRAG